MTQIGFIKGCLIAVAALLCSQPILAQEHCLTPAEIKAMVDQVKSNQTVSLNKKLRDELLKIREKDQERLYEDISKNRKPPEVMKGLRESRLKNATTLCAMLKKYGWLTPDLVGKEAADAAFFIIRNSSSGYLKVDLVPVVVAAASKGQISRPDFAGYVDRLRLEAGLKQIFGTQATVLDGFIVLFPIEGEIHVDDRRKQFELPPLGDYLRFLQAKYRLPLIKSTGALTNRFSENLKSSIAKTTSAGLLEGEPIEEDEVVRVDTNLVSLNVSVYSDKLRNHVTSLTQKDFTISEDGNAQDITYFATTDVPFDLVLLIDLSGSTSTKRKLIRLSTQKFIEATRPSDRIAIVTFAESADIVSPLTDNRAKLLESVLAIGDETGGSHVWDALKFTLDKVLGPKTLDRRRAVVFMTDGIDNALSSGQVGSDITFADLLEAVRRNDALIVPIYLDTEEGAFTDTRVFESARKTLALLADESGGLYYRARRIEDLEGVYGQVIEDLGKVYSLGYKPTNDKRDRTWRTVKVQLPNQPDLSARTRPGYYAN